MTIGIHGAETRLQAGVLRELSGGDNTIVMKLIDKISPELREIITDFETKDGRLPSADEMIWIIGEHHKLDPHYVSRLLEDSIDFAETQTVNVAIREYNSANVSH